MAEDQIHEVMSPPFHIFIHVSSQLFTVLEKSLLSLQKFSLNVGWIVFGAWVATSAVRDVLTGLVRVL